MFVCVGRVSRRTGLSIERKGQPRHERGAAQERPLLDQEAAHSAQALSGEQRRRVRHEPISRQAFQPAGHGSGAWFRSADENGNDGWSGSRMELRALRSRTRELTADRVYPCAVRMVGVRRATVLGLTYAQHRGAAAQAVHAHQCRGCSAQQEQPHRHYGEPRTGAQNLHARQK